MFAGSSCIPFKVQYENGLGAVMVSTTKKQLIHCLHLIYNFQDSVGFSMVQAQKNVDRALVQTKSIIENMDRKV